MVTCPPKGRGKLASPFSSRGWGGNVLRATGISQEKKKKKESFAVPYKKKNPRNSIRREGPAKKARKEASQPKVKQGAGKVFSSRLLEKRGGRAPLTPRLQYIANK